VRRRQLSLQSATAIAINFYLAKYRVKIRMISPLMGDGKGGLHSAIFAKPNTCRMSIMRLTPLGVPHSS